MRRVAPEQASHADDDAAGLQRGKLAREFRLSVDAARRLTRKALVVGPAVVEHIVGRDIDRRQDRRHVARTLGVDEAGEGLVPLAVSEAVERDGVDRHVVAVKRPLAGLGVHDLDGVVAQNTYRPLVATGESAGERLPEQASPDDGDSHLRLSIHLPMASFRSICCFHASALIRHDSA